MAEIEISYLLPESPRRSEDFEKIVSAIGAYQSELPFPASHHHDARIENTENGAVLLKLVRTLHTAENHDQLQHVAEMMHQGVESHFTPEDRQRLAGFFVDASNHRA